MLKVNINNEDVIFEKYEIVKDMVIFYLEPKEGKILTCVILKEEIVFLHDFGAFLKNEIFSPVIFALSAIDELVFPKTPEEWMSENFVKDFLTPVRLQIQKKFWLKLKGFLITEKLL